MSDNIQSNISNERLLSVRNVKGENQDLINLSSKFPNVLFYAENESVGALNNKKDLYLGGFKYTRFHGLGKNMVTVGDYRIILSFDEDSGLLSISLDSSIDAMWLCGIDNTNSIITYETNLSDIEQYIINSNNISNYIYNYEYNDDSDTNRYGIMLFNKGNNISNNNSSTNNEDFVTLLFALVSEGTDISNIKFNIANNNLVSFGTGQPFILKNPNSSVFRKILAQTDLQQLDDNQNLYICPIKVSIINSGVFSNQTVQINPEILIPIEENETYTSNFIKNKVLSSLSQNNYTKYNHTISTNDIGYDQTNLNNFNIFETSPVTSLSDKVILKCNMFVESTIQTITLSTINNSTNDEYIFKLNLNIAKNTENSNSIPFNNDELVNFLINKNIIKFAVQIEKNNSSITEIIELNQPYDEDSENGYIIYDNNLHSCVYHNNKKHNLLVNELKNINIFLLVDDQENNHPKFPLIKFISKSNSVVKQLYPVFKYNNLSYYIKQTNGTLSLSDTSLNSKCIAACNLVKIGNISKVIYISYVDTFNSGNNIDEYLTNIISYNNGTLIDALNNNDMAKQKLSLNDVNNKNILILYTGNQVDGLQVSLNIMKIQGFLNSTYIPIDSQYIDTGQIPNTLLSYIYIKHNEMEMSITNDNNIRYVFFK